ncbi:reverse transcriptase [Cucumis melo var. makuwa]|uniref:Reverse transcriptase n=1 Tax=Cucumis melo var. makuwa TaxID=1194695 RepID=A0A5A7V6D3_CUCMM|nr:reverse transcriptase [Cucumis melo var. makuwa]TYK14739.1 reverse transcriptase [Cucumis melo var. makuwa]
MIDAVASRVKGLQIQELLARVDTLEENVERTGSHEREGSSTGSVACIEERVQEVTNTVAEEAKVTLATMHLSKDAKLWWRSRIWKHVKQFAGLMLDIRDMSKKDKVFCFVEGLKPWANTKLYEQRVQDLTSVYAAVEQLFDLSNDSQDASLASDSDDRLGQTEREVDQMEEVNNPQMGALKFLSSLQKKVGETNTSVERDLMYIDTWINQKPTKSTMVDSGATHNFRTKAEAKRLNPHWEKDAERMKAMNSTVLPIMG